MAVTSAEDVRTLVKGSNLLLPADIAKFLHERLLELRSLGLSTKVKTANDLIPVLAKDMKRKSPNEQKSDQAWESDARSQIEGNKTTALTTSDDRYTGLEGGLEFDEIHELVHICSARGGESDLHQYKLQVNEGAINYFAELVAPLLGVTVVDRYTKETKVIKKLVAVIGDTGPQTLYAAAFKSEVTPFFTTLGTKYAALANNYNGIAKNFSDKKKTASEWATEFQNQARNWSLTWLEGKLSTKGDFTT